ncbi:MAG: Na/Pi symporter, partial [Pseudomonadota bacterium]
MVTFLILLGLFGGLGLFFYGFHITGKSLQTIASLSIKKSIEKLTKNVFMSTVVGFFITALVQSSSATTVFLVNFINAGLISLTNSMGIIFGANVGTTITVQVISLNLDQYVFPAIGLGAFLKLFSNKRSLKMFGEITLGFGLIFLGIIVMKNAVLPLQSSGVFQNLLSHTSSGTLIGIATGLALSAITAALIHSSAGTLAIVIALSSIGAFTDIRQVIP